MTNHLVPYKNYMNMDGIFSDLKQEAVLFAQALCKGVAFKDQLYRITAQLS